MSDNLVSINTLIDQHPQLTEKALIDFINGLEVTDDHIRVQNNVNSGFLSRTWSSINGESALRQNTINQHFGESLKTVSVWLENLQHQTIQSDLALIKVSEKLKETRTGLMMMLERHQSLKYQVDEIIVQIEDMKNHHQQLSARLELVDCGRLATQHMNAVFDKWKAGGFRHFPILTRLFLVYDELYWGDFGHYCRQCGLEHREIKRLVEQVQNKSLIQLESEWQKSNSPYLWENDTKNQLQNLNTDYREMIVYLTNGAPLDEMPLTWGLNQLANNPSQDYLNNSNLPKFLDMQNAINRMSFEFEARYVKQYI